MDDLKVFSGNAHPALAQAIADYLGMPLGRAEVFEFANENIFVRILDNVRERDTFVVQPISSPVNKSLVELLIIGLSYYGGHSLLRLRTHRPQGPTPCTDNCPACRRPADHGRC